MDSMEKREGAKQEKEAGATRGSMQHAISVRKSGANLDPGVGMQMLRVMHVQMMLPPKQGKVVTRTRHPFKRCIWILKVGNKGLGPDKKNIHIRLDTRIPKRG